MTTAPFIRAVAAASLLVSGGSCHLVPDMPDPLNFPEAKARNLEQLHSPDGSYRYNANILDDFGYLIESISGRDRDATLSPSAVANPASETLLNLADLLRSPPASGDAGDLQVQWCARLASSDPSALVRERAALGLGPLGRWSGIRGFRPLSGGPFATPENVGGALEGLMRGLRLIREDGDEGEALKAACLAARSLNLDLEGAWRLLSATVALRGDHLLDAVAGAELQGLGAHLRVRLVEVGIYNSLNDPSDLVRAAALRSMVVILGPRAMAGFLSQPMPGWSDTVIVGIVDLVAQYGLPSEGVSDQVQFLCLSSLVDWALNHPSPRVRARAMLALQRGAPTGPRSLREEDWHRWWQTANAAAGPSS
jgi:hypothetical protein